MRSGKGVLCGGEMDRREMVFRVFDRLGRERKASQKKERE